MYPPYGIGGTIPASGPWFHLMTPYLKNQQILACPSDTNKNQSGDSWWYPNGVTAYHTSYGFNNNLSVRALAAIESTASTVMLCDINGVPDAAKEPEDWGYETVNSPWILDHVTNANVAAVSGGSPAHYSGPRARHSGMCNVAWADGHVKSMKVDRFYVYKTNAASPCLNPATGCP